MTGLHSILSKTNDINDIKKLNINELNTLSREIRDKLKDLDYDKEKKKKIKKELAFLSKEKQIEYLEELADYKEHPKSN